MVKEKLPDKVRNTIRVRHLSYRTEEAYLNWIKELSPDMSGNFLDRPALVRLAWNKLFSL